MLIEKPTLVAQLAPPLDQQLTEQLVDEYISQEKRFIQRDWEPSQLDGGQFCEVLSRILYHVDSGNLNRGKDGDESLKYVENDQNPHALQPRQTALHIAKVTGTVYKFEVPEVLFTFRRPTEQTIWTHDWSSKVSVGYLPRRSGFGGRTTARKSLRPLGN